MLHEPRPASEADAAEILVLQRCCWVTEAITNETLDIPALHEDLDTVRGWLREMAVWTVRVGPRLVAAVRAHQLGDRWHIGRLMVAPDLRGRGLGRLLLEYAQDQAPPDVTRFELFTGARSAGNLALYRSAGYRQAPSNQCPPGTILLTRPAAQRGEVRTAPP